MVVNSRTKVMMESINVIVDDSQENKPNVQKDVGTSYLQNDDSGMEEETAPSNEDIETEVDDP